MPNYPNNWAVVIPLANEEAELPEFAEALRSVMDAAEGGTVYFVVDRVSKDRTLECCEELSARDPRFVTKWIPRKPECRGCVYQRFPGGAHWRT